MFNFSACLELNILESLDPWTLRGHVAQACTFVRAFATSTKDHSACPGIKLQVAPGEARARLVIVERRHVVLRTALEMHMTDANLELSVDAVREAL